MHTKKLAKLLNNSAVQALRSKFFNEIDNFRIVGGAVRDALLDRKLIDIDFATSYNPTELIALCKEKKVKYIETGLKHGTITIIIESFSYEVTSLRKDIQTNGRHAIVSYGRNWQEDSLRRDFTINALYLGFSGKLYDFHDGLTDLQNKKLCFIGDPRQRIKEDFLRILRLLRFFAQLNDFHFDNKLLEICQSLRRGIKNLSAARIRAEFFKILRGTNYYQALKYLVRYNLCDYFIQINDAQLKLLAKYSQINTPPPKIKVLLALIIIHSKDWQATFNLLNSSLNLTRIEKQQIKFIINNKLITLPNNDIEKQKLLFKYGLSNLKLLYQYYIFSNYKLYNDYQGDLLKINNLTIPKFPVTGNDLQKKGFVESVNLGNMLKLLTYKWLDSNMSLSKQNLLEILSIEE